MCIKQGIHWRVVGRDADTQLPSPRLWCVHNLTLSDRFVLWLRLLKIKEGQNYVLLILIWNQWCLQRQRLSLERVLFSFHVFSYIYESLEICFCMSSSTTFISSLPNISLFLECRLSFPSQLAKQLWTRTIYLLIWCALRNIVLFIFQHLHNNTYSLVLFMYVNLPVLSSCKILYGYPNTKSQEICD